MRGPGVGLVMPGLVEWFGRLSARLRHVRICNGDYKRVLTGGATRTLSVRQGGVCGVFLDPPYADTAERADGLYAHDSLDVAHEAAEWAVAHGDDRDYRIVFAGFDGEHGDLFEAAGWAEVEWYTDGWLAGGMGGQQHRERLWLSPHCVAAGSDPQMSLFDDT